MKKINYFLVVSLILFIYGCASTQKLDWNKEIKINSRQSWQALDPKPFKSHVPKRLTIHHEGEIFKEGDDARAFIKKTQVWCMGPERNWADIPYHFLIDLDGNIYEGRNPFTQGETNTTYNTEGHLLITLLGNFEEQKVPEAQLNALVKLAAYCCIKYDLPVDSIAAHRDFAETLCPGKDLYQYFSNGYIKNTVKKLVKENPKLN